MPGGMDVGHFANILSDLGADFFTGVPDSLLAPLMDHVMVSHGISPRHVVAANEGAAVGLAAGHYLTTGKPAVVYMQNSGLGNALNPICSLLHKEVYAIPAIFVIGWRGEPGTRDEPQHKFQGKVTLALLDCLEIPYVVITKDGAYPSLPAEMEKFKVHIENGQSVAFVVCGSSLQNESKMKYASTHALAREQALDVIVDHADADDVFVCTTGKLSREMFEIRERKGMGHGRDFLTVGSMGHSIMIAHGIAVAKPDIRVFCLDGDGSALMHLGSLAVVGVNNPANLVHIVINNGAHESVGGMPTVCADLKLSELALSLGYSYGFRVATKEDLLTILCKLKDLDGAVFVEILCNLESRMDLGRPSMTPIQNKVDFMDFLRMNE